MSFCTVAKCLFVAIVSAPSGLATDDSSFDSPSDAEVSALILNGSSGDFLARRAAAMSSNDTAVNMMGSGKCSSKDQSIWNRHGPGNHAGSFPQIIGKCGKSSWSLWWGFDSAWMGKCVTGKTGISSGCAGCFAAAGTYGYRNCKSSCFWSWCSQGCLDCAKAHEPTLLQCLGADPPDAKRC